MQNAALAALGLNWRYLAFEVNPAELGAVLAGAKQLGFVGFNLTVPHKLVALPLVEELDDSARRWGAVNTIRFETNSAGRIIARGFNTDADGLSKSVREDLQLDPNGARVLLLGAGGAGRAAALKLACDGAAELYLVNRTPAKAEAVAAEIRTQFPGVRVATHYPAGAVDLVLNATSLGLRADDVLPLDEGKFSLRQARTAYDMIYRPAHTPFLAAAAAAGCQTANGLGMLLHQGAQALEIWTGRPAPLAVMRAALEKNIYGH
jgi:shikimate dehydrogenase